MDDEARALDEFAAGVSCAALWLEHHFLTSG